MKTGVHAIIQKINADAEQHGNERYTQIRDEIDKEIERENAFYRDELDKRCEALKKQNEHEYDRRLERINSRLHRELLSYQSGLLDGIFDAAVSKLRDISEKEFLAMFKSAIFGLKGSFDLYLGALSAGRLDARKINRIVRGSSGLDIVLNAETIPDKSGFVLKDDRIELNALFEDLIEDKKTRQAAAILKEVFMDG